MDSAAIQGPVPLLPSLGKLLLYIYYNYILYIELLDYAVASATASAAATSAASGDVI